MLAVFLFEYLPPMIFNSSAVRAFDISANAGAGNIGKVFENFFEPSSDAFWRFIIHEAAFHEDPQFFVQGDLLPLGTVVPQPDIRKLFGILRIIRVAFAFLLQFVPEATLGALQAFGDVSD